MDTALTQKFPFILDMNLVKANCTENHVCTSCDIVVLGTLPNHVLFAMFLQALSDIEHSRNKMEPPTIAPVPFGAPVDPKVLRGRYTWEDRIRDDTTHTATNLNETDDGYGYHCVSISNRS